MAFWRLVLLPILVSLALAQTELNRTESETSAVLNTTLVTPDDSNVTRIDGLKHSKFPDVIDCDVRHGLIANPYVESGCDRHFYSCDYFFGIRMECPHDLFFDLDTLDCQPWHEVHACSGFTHTTSLPHSTSFQPPTPTFDHRRFSCLHKANGNYADVTSEKPRCARRYLTCDNGKLILQWCLHGFVFDEYSDKCDVHDNVFDCTGRTHFPTSTLPSSTRKLHVVDFDCTNKTNGLYPNPLKKCDRIFYSCGDGIAYEEECPNYLVYDPEKEKCHRREDTFDCTNVRHSTTIPPPTRTPKILHGFNCGGLPDGSLHADPNTPCADYFIECSGEQAIIMDCPSGSFFNNATNQCDYRWNVASCRGAKWNRPTWPTTADLTRATPVPDASVAPLAETGRPGRPWGMRRRGPERRRQFE